jgi:hypothetical protein
MLPGKAPANDSYARHEYTRHAILFERKFENAFVTNHGSTAARCGFGNRRVYAAFGSIDIRLNHNGIALLRLQVEEHGVATLGISSAVNWWASDPAYSSSSSHGLPDFRIRPRRIWWMPRC